MTRIAHPIKKDNWLCKVSSDLTALKQYMTHGLQCEQLGRFYLVKLCVQNTVQSLNSSLIWLALPHLHRMYSLNREESTPPPHEHVIQKPLCCNRSSTCSHMDINSNKQELELTVDPDTTDIQYTRRVVLTWNQQNYWSLINISFVKICFNLFAHQWWTFWGSHLIKRCPSLSLIVLCMFLDVFSLALFLLNACVLSTACVFLHSK